MNKNLIALLVSAAMVIAPLPAMSANSGPLAPGSAAGVKQAQGMNDDVPLLWLVGAGAVIALGVLALSNNNDNGSPATSPTTTTTTATTTTTTTTTAP